MYIVTGKISGQKYKAEAKYINQTKSEWYVPPVTDQMDFQTLTFYKDKLEAQIQMWMGYYAGAKSKEARNLDMILQVQEAKFAEYTEALARIAPAGSYQDPGTVEDPSTGKNPVDPLPPSTDPKEAGGSLTPLLIGGAVLLLLMMKK